MTPTNLAALPSASPPPTGRLQFARASGELTRTYSAASLPVDMGAPGTVMSISVTPVYDCIWVVKGNAIFQGSAGSGMGWNRFDMAIDISPADADGRTRLGQCCMELYDGNTVGWRTYSNAAAFRLVGGTAYTAKLRLVYGSGGSASCFFGANYGRLVGRIVGEGVL